MNCFRAFRYIFMLLLVYPSLGIKAQIIPRAAPVILHLSATGDYTVNINDIATISAYNYNLEYSPQSFSCNDIGQQQVFISTTSDNGTKVSFNHPSGITFDAAGNIYVSEMGGQTIRKITTAGVVSTFAGTGAPGYQDGNGTAAAFNNPNGIVADAAGNIYVADGDNHVIRKITPTGAVSTFAGSGAVGKADGTGTAASFYEPAGMAIDAAGTLYVVDEFNANIRKISPAGVVTTLAGSGGNPGYRDGQGTSASFTLPYGITLDAAGNSYVTDIQNYRIRKISPLGLVSTLAGNGIASNIDGSGTQASFGNLYGITIDKTGNLYVYSGTQIRKITAAGVVSTFSGMNMAGNPFDNTGLLSRFNNINSMITDAAGNMYFTDMYNNQVRMISPAGLVSTIAGNGNQADVNGNIGDLATLNIRQKYVPVTIAPIITVATTNPARDNVAAGLITVQVPLADAVFNYTGCTPTLRTYLVPFSSYCATLNAQLVPPKPFSYTVTQTPPAGTLLQNNMPTKLTFVYADSWGGADTVSFNVTALNGNTGPPPTVKIKASANPICAGVPVTFTTEATNLPEQPNYQWFVNGKLAGYNDNFTASNLANGDKVSCVLIVVNSICFTPVKSDVFTVAVTGAPTISFNKNPFIEPGNSIQLNPAITGDIVKYNWTPATGLDDPTIANPVASPIESTIYTLTVTSSTGCTVSKKVTVKVDTDLHEPTAFSPNGDGINDTWNIKALRVFPDCTVAVFNRYGERVFYSKGYTTGWDGTFNGKTLPTGTYYYIIKTTPRNPVSTGSISIIK